MHILDSDADVINNVMANFDASNPLHLAILIVGILIIAVSLVSVGVSIMLMIKYVRFNKRNNSMNQTGEVIARTILDKNGLENIKVSKNGSILFGNSYSHYFKKVRLRRRTWKKTSVTSMAMAAQKSCLAILDKEGDPDMKTRVVLTPIVFFGPYAFVPLIILGLIIDIVTLNTVGIATLICSLLGAGLFVAAFVIQIVELKTEKKAQEKAYEIVKADGVATDEEIEMMKELFKLYNIEYVNNIVLTVLEIIWRILMIVANVQGSTSTSSNN